MTMAPTLLTFDIFGTVLDWRVGLTKSLFRHGVELGDFDRVIDLQGELEQRVYQSYASITAQSIADLVGPERAAAIGREVGTWPLFADSAPALQKMMALCACGAMTNSDVAHGEDVQRSLGFRLTHWVCAEDLRIYKPNPAFFDAVRDRTGHAYDASWWHVSAYTDYDLDVAASLGLTTVYIPRPHSRAAPAKLTFPDLEALAEKVAALHAAR